MSQKLESAIAVIGIDTGKNSFHVVGHDERGAIVTALSDTRPARSSLPCCPVRVNCVEKLELVKSRKR